MKSSGNTTRSQDARAIWENARVQRRNKEPDDTATWKPVHIATLPSATAHDRLPSSATSAVVVMTIPASSPCERLQICDPVVPGAGECPSHLRTPEERTACAVWHALGAGNDRAAAVPRAAPEAQVGGEVVVVSRRADAHVHAHVNTLSQMCGRQPGTQVSTPHTTSLAELRNTGPLHVNGNSLCRDYVVRLARTLRENNLRALMMVSFFLFPAATRRGGERGGEDVTRGVMVRPRTK